jgi:hypothetical protein
MGMTMTGIDHRIEALEALPHELGCFEAFAEELVEAGVAQAGEHDEILRGGMTVMARFHRDMVEGASECACQGPHDALIED